MSQNNTGFAHCALYQRKYKERGIEDPTSAAIRKQKQKNLEERLRKQRQQMKEQQHLVHKGLLRLTQENQHLVRDQNQFKARLKGSGKLERSSPTTSQEIPEKAVRNSEKFLNKKAHTEAGSSKVKEAWSPKDPSYRIPKPPKMHLGE